MAFQAGDRSFAVQYTTGSPGSYQFQEQEFLTEQEALELSEKVLREQLCSQVSVIKWQHVANLPGALPAVVAKSLALTTYRLADDQMVSKPVDIFGSCY